MSVINRPIYAEFSGERKEIINGKVVNDTSVHTKYDGKKLHIDKRNKNHFTHYTVKNDDTIKKLLNTPSSKMNLINRLTMDFSHRKTKAKRKKTKAKSKKTKAKSKKTKANRKN